VRATTPTAMPAASRSRSEGGIMQRPKNPDPSSAPPAPPTPSPTSIAPTWKRSTRPRGNQCWASRVR
jgi:hypothetical protein